MERVCVFRLVREPLRVRSLNQNTTLNNGYLGSRNDEERSEMRYVVRIAGCMRVIESLNAYCARGFGREHVCLSVTDTFRLPSFLSGIEAQVGPDLSQSGLWAATGWVEVKRRGFCLAGALVFAPLRHAVWSADFSAFDRCEAGLSLLP